ncbi:hypothetical protein AAG906_039293 [Vitis piasezkii]
MVGAHCTTFSFFTLATTTVGVATTIIQKKAIILFSTSKSFSLKPRKRKNYLRPKLDFFDQTSNESFTIVIKDDDEIAHQNEAESCQFLLSLTPSPTKVENGEVGNFSTGSLLKLGVYLVGIFVNFFLNVGGKFFGKKIGNKSSYAVSLNEAMTKEARESEGKKLKNNGMNSYLEEVGGGDVDENANSSIRSGIQEEVDAWLLKFHLNKFCKVENRVNGNHSDVAELNRTLMFKKKMKFRNAPSMPRNDPKGFQLLENNRIVDTAGNSQQNDSSSLEEDCGRNALSKESSLLQNHGKNFTKENHNTVTKPNAVLSRNGYSNCRKVGSKPVAKGSRDKSSDIKADLWCGLYTLKTTSHESDPIDSSCTVAFEDRGDATNLCDFNADIVPLLIKNLITTQSMLFYLFCFLFSLLFSIFLEAKQPLRMFSQRMRG